MAVCCCSLAGTAACRTCANNPDAETSPYVMTYTTDATGGMASENLGQPRRCANCKHWFDNGTNLASCDRDALLREKDFFCAAWEQGDRKQTNADRIRAMSIDKIIEWFCRGRHCGSCPYFGVECGIREWLQSPAEKDGET